MSNIIYWPKKDPDEVYDYSWTVPLDDGDAIATFVITPTGATTVLVDSDSFSGAVATAILSGGAEDEIATFDLRVTTTGGDTFDAKAVLPVYTSSAIADNSGYTLPTAELTKGVFTKFCDIADPIVDFWISRASRQVDTSWTEGDYQMGVMLLAAHFMTLEGLGSGTEAEIAKGGLAGLKTVKSGNFSFTKDEQGGSAAAGSIESTSYGARWLELLKQNKAGARISPSGTVPQFSLYQGV